MSYKLTALLLASIVLSACVGLPSNPDGQATYYIDQAKAAYSSGQKEAAGNFIWAALIKPTGADKVRNAFKDSPGLQSAYFDNVSRRISRIRDLFDVDGTLAELDLAKRTSVFTSAQVATLETSFSEVLSEGNKSGKIKLTLASQTGSFPFLNTSEHRRIIVNRTIDALIANEGNRERMLPELMKHIQKAGRDSEDGRRVEALLPSMRIHRNELDAVAAVYPEFVRSRRANMRAKVQVQVKNADRLFADDVVSAIKSGIRGIDLVQAPGDKVTTITVERARHEERIIPERTQTITYSTSDMNLIQAALFMPRNASYLFDHISGGAEIEYGYVVTAVQDGKTIFDEVVRGKLGGEYHRCQNPRIQNIFGGVSKAEFVANDDMQARCSGSSSAVPMDDLRRKVFDKVVEGILQIAPIQAAHEVN